MCSLGSFSWKSLGLHGTQFAETTRINNDPYYVKIILGNKYTISDDNHVKNKKLYSILT